MAELKNVADRARLKPGREPHWQAMTTGNYLGFRKMKTASEGTWVARSRDAASGKQRLHALGAFEALRPSERFDAAKAEAEKWFRHLDRGGTASEPVTVKTACANYVTNLRAAGKDGSARDAEQRFARWVDGAKIGTILLQKLKPGDVDAWRKALAATKATPQDKTQEPTRPRSASTLNRDMTSLRAALNLALEDGHVTTDAAWRVKLRPVKDADRRRDTYLDLAQRRALIAKAPPDLADYLRALSLVPLRPGAMAALTAGNFDRRLGVLTIGKDKHGQDRKIALPPATAEFFADRAKDKLPGAPLLTRADGSAWNKDAWKYPVRDAVAAAELPGNVTAYALRHSTITDLVRAGLDVLTVATLSGTSILMIQKHYGHLNAEHAAKALEALTL
ncbi:MAG: tyrosine-type recombinase/integrase [Burkholderiales bacterium]|nr:tyrosine-type recombinase/integrase [Burkholderiales bacterium]